MVSQLGGVPLTALPLFSPVQSRIDSNDNVSAANILSLRRRSIRGDCCDDDTAFVLLHPQPSTGDKGPQVLVCGLERAVEGPDLLGGGPVGWERHGKSNLDSEVQGVSELRRLRQDS